MIKASQSPRWAGPSEDGCRGISGEGGVRLLWATEEHSIWGLDFPKPKHKTYKSWRRSSVFLPDVKSSLEIKVWSSNFGI